ncbi:sensor domain-containing phosphodiesterase [Massilia sp. DD77]|uniref:sensor domain-containing phosphodiesterase n=1 Tax=Massilia sp. DD77 TaxID=3109349 RepID=UPI002FFE2FA6
MREDRNAGSAYSRVEEVDENATASGAAISAEDGGALASGARLLYPPVVSNDALLLDPPDPKLDCITRLAVMAAGADIGGISLMFQSQIWLPSRIGMSTQLMPRSGSFCSRAVEAAGGYFEVHDALQDPRFADNPLVTAPPHYRHYAAVLLKGPGNHLRGTLWVMGRTPRTLAIAQASQLTLLARIAADMLELRYCEPTTGMFNRTVFLHHLGRLLAHGSGATTIGYIDLNAFRQVNGMFGRAAADRLLMMLGERLEAWDGDGTLLAHLGGDKFAFALPSTTERHEEKIRRLCVLIDQPFDLGDGYRQTMHARIGLRRQQAPWQGPAAELLDAADTAASSASRNTGTSVVCEYDNALVARTRLRYELREVIRGDRRHGLLDVHYQPQIDVAAGRLIGMEALVRWRHPEFGLVAPGMFVPEAERSGGIVDLDLRVLELVCRDLGAWRARGLELAPVSLNFSRLSLMHADILPRMAAVLQATGVPGELLELEVTESVLLDTLQPLHARIGELRGLGVRIAVDDFGIGSSNLDALDNFHFDRLKADRQFVHGVASDRKKAGLFSLIQGIAGVFDAELVCEGLEDEADMAWLLDRGAHCVQGWLFSRARPADEIERVLLRFQEARGRTLSVEEVRGMLG